MAKQIIKQNIVQITMNQSGGLYAVTENGDVFYLFRPIDDAEWEKVKDIEMVVELED